MFCCLQSRRDYHLICAVNYSRCGDVMNESKIVYLDEIRKKKLPPKEFAKAIMTLPAKERMEAILDRSDAVAVVRSMPEQDLYVTVMEIGPDDALSLLSLASTEQWVHFFDMECWKKDRILPAQGIEWLERLARSGYEPLVRWLYGVEFFFLISLVKKWLRVAVKPDDIDLTEARDYLPPNTIDDTYFWECKYPQYEELIKHILSILYETNYTYYREVMEHAMLALDAEVEEEAYRFHRGRLEDLAIPDYYDAIEIYAPMEPNDIVQRELYRAPNTPTGEYDKEPSVASFPLVHSGRSDFLKQVMESIDSATLTDQLRLELVALANRVIIADGVFVGDPDQRTEALDKVYATLNLGLHFLSGGQRDQAVKVVNNVFLEHIFRVGFGLIHRLGRRARRLIQHGWLAHCPTGMNLLEPPWYETLEALSERFPMFYRKAPLNATVSSWNPRQDFFRTPTDIAEASADLDTIACLGAVMGLMKIDWDQIELELWRDGQVLTLNDLTVTHLLFTAAANAMMSGSNRWIVRPLPVKEWPVLYRKLHPSTLLPYIRNVLNMNIPGENWQKSLERYLEPIFDEYKEEMSELCSAQEPPDPRWVRFFIFR